MARERNVMLGVVFGVIFAILYSVLALVIFLFRGDAPFETNAITLGSTIAVYFLGGIFGGAVVGFLLPWTTRRVGSVIVGMIAGLPVCLGFVFVLDGPVPQWDQSTVWAAVITAILLGGWGGYTFWEPVTERLQPPDDPSQGG